MNNERPFNVNACAVEALLCNCNVLLCRLNVVDLFECDFIVWRKLSL